MKSIFNWSQICY